MRDDPCTALLFRPSRSDLSPGRELMRQLNDLLDAQYPGRAVKPGSVTTPEEMVPPTGTFLVGYDNGRPVARSRGIGRALLGQIVIRRGVTRRAAHAASARHGWRAGG